MPVVALFIGSRSWVDEAPIRERLERLPEGSTVVSGGARGADSIAARLAKDMVETHGFTVKVIRAAWEVTADTPGWAIRYLDNGHRYDVRAGPLRNDLMLDENPDYVFAFSHSEKPEGGTADCVGKARRRHMAVEVVTPARADFTPGVPALF